MKCYEIQNTPGGLEIAKKLISSEVVMFDSLGNMTTGTLINVTTSSFYISMKTAEGSYTYFPLHIIQVPIKTAFIKLHPRNEGITYTIEEPTDHIFV